MGTEKKDKGKTEAKDEKLEKEPVEEKIVVTTHETIIDEQKIKYEATAGTIVLFEEVDEKGVDQKASIFFIAYTKKGEKPEERPITFSFNGGPGSSSVWMHLGLLGPKIVYAEKEDKPEPVSPPYKLERNPYSLLDVSDLVFIDPVSTGYSRPVKGEKSEQFHGFKKDIESVGEFIRLYTTRYNRWLSPKFLIGESYGTTRASGLSGFLQDQFGMYLNGIMLISAILNFQTAYFTTGNDLPFITFLPTYTTTAWYHKKLPKPLQEKPLQDVIKEVKEFAMNEYTLALMKGDALPDEERALIKEKLAFYTGLSEKYLEFTNIRINIYKFVKELLRDQKRTIGRLDSRYIGIDRDSTEATVEYDPSYTSIQGPYTATLYDYVRRELKYESDLRYEILKPLYQNWDYGDFKNRFVDVAETLRSAISKNHALKIFIANGYYDFATPFFATEYTFNHLGLDPMLRGNITMKYYEAGHMMYLHRPSLKQLKQDLKEFILSAVPQES